MGLENVGYVYQTKSLCTFLQIQVISLKISNTSSLYLHLRKGFVPIQAFETMVINAFALRWHFFSVINPCQIKYFCAL